MPRPKKTKIKLDVDSMSGLMQEIYNDCVSVQRKAQGDITERKTQLKIEDSNDMYQLGKVNNESLKIIDSAIDKKLTLAKLQAQILMNNNQSEEKVNSPKALTDDDKKLLRDMMKEQKIKKDVDFELE
jgi:hypothetical protein